VLEEGVSLLGFSDSVKGNDTHDDDNDDDNNNGNDNSIIRQYFCNTLKLFHRKYDETYRQIQVWSLTRRV